MPRATNKKQLIEDSRREYDALEQLLAQISPEQMTVPGALGDWSVKDVLAHLIEWQQMLLGWYAAGVRGENPAVPAEGYKWNQIPELNQHIYEKHRERELNDVLDNFRASHRQTMALIRELSDEDLFTRGLHTWTNNNTLGTYFVSASGSHYLWARKEMRKNLFPKKKKENV